MANKQHLALLKQGITIWNDWRQKNPKIQPDLTQANFEGENLDGANLVVQKTQSSLKLRI